MAASPARMIATSNKFAATPFLAKKAII